MDFAGREHEGTTTTRELSYSPDVYTLFREGDISVKCSFAKWTRGHTVSMTENGTAHAQTAFCSDRLRMTCHSMTYRMIHFVRKVIHKTRIVRHQRNGGGVSKFSANGSARIVVAENMWQ